MTYTHCPTKTRKSQAFPHQQGLQHGAPETYPEQIEDSGLGRRGIETSGKSLPQALKRFDFLGAGKNYQNLGARFCFGAIKFLSLFSSLVFVDFGYF